SGSALSADGKTVACGAADGHNDVYFEGENYIGRRTTAHVWEVGSLATSPPDPVPPADDAEALVVEAITKLGGKVTRDDKLPGKPVIGVNLTNTGVTDAGL